MPECPYFCAGTDILSLCTPTGINGWTYTQKQTTLAVEGMFMNKQNQLIQFDEKTFASLDDTCGFYVPRQRGSGFHVIFGMNRGDVLG